MRYIHERGCFVKTVHKVGNHSALPELQESQDMPIQGFKKGLKYDGRKMLQISTQRKRTKKPLNLPIQVSTEKDSTLTEQNLNKRNWKTPHSHTCSSSCRFKVRDHQINEGPQRCGCTGEKGISPRLSLLSHEGLDTQYCTEKNN